MPKVARDPELHLRLCDYLERSGKGASHAADELGLDHLLVWRYQRTGRALPRNAALIRDALERAAVTGDPEVGARGSDVVDEMQTSEITKYDIARLRKFLHHVLAVVDAYEDAVLHDHGRVSRHRPARKPGTPDGRSG